MTQVQTERVLVVPAELFHRLGYFQGFSSQVDRFLPELFSTEHTSFRPRHSVEEDPRFKQLIPYVIFRHRDTAGGVHVFRYTRGKGQGGGGGRGARRSAPAGRLGRGRVRGGHFLSDGQPIHAPDRLGPAGRRRRRDADAQTRVRSFGCPAHTARSGGAVHGG